jgi:hypothetical protein
MENKTREKLIAKTKLRKPDDVQFAIKAGKFVCVKKEKINNENNKIVNIE